jgi:hypothetical protein
MNPEQIKAEIRKLNIPFILASSSSRWHQTRPGSIKIGIYRRINREAAGDRGIGTVRSLQIRQEIERTSRFPAYERALLSAESKIHRTTRLSYHPKIFVVIK